MKQKQAIIMAIVLAASSMLVTACKSERLHDDTAASSISAYNHTPDYIHQFYIDDAWGGNSFAYGGGGGFVCCATYPRKWHQGLSAKVRWTTSSSDPNATGAEAEETWHEAIVPIEKYNEPGTVQVHFLPKGKIRIVVSNLMSGHPDYPGPDYPIKPPDFNFEPWHGAASEAEARARSRGAQRVLKANPDDPALLPPEQMPLYPKERQ